jgi:ATP-binding cassette subfamily B protein
MLTKSAIVFYLLLLTLCATSQSKWSLEACITYALKNNIAIKQAGLQTRFSALVVSQNRSSQWPSLSFSGNSGYRFGLSENPTTGTLQSSNYFSSGFSLSSGVTLFNWFAKRHSLNASQLTAEADKMGVKKAENDVALNVSAAYLQALLAKEGKNIIITFLAAKAVIEGQMTLGSMLAVQYIIGQLNSPIEQMIGFVQSWQAAKISMDRLNEIHSMEDEEPEDKEFQYSLPAAFAKRIVGGSPLNPPVGDLSIAQLVPPQREPLLLQEVYNNKPIHLSGVSVSDGLPSADAAGMGFRNVSFTYPGAGNEPVLKGINLFIPAGKTTAIVGTSGSGKTTLLKLLLKIYEPQKGDIRLDNTSLSNISHKHWRSHCSVVMQESFIFSDTISRNIALGTERINMEQLYRAVEVANILEFIESLPLGFNTRIGAEGTGISMGQKQRILIARAVYRNPDFIFFDEATNSLDAHNESVIIKNLNHFFEGKTVVVVAHRLSTVKGADQIVVLNKGVISERGTHSELISLKGEYYHLIKNQLELGN